MPSRQDRNYFELFGLSAAFDLDLNDLTHRYRGLARATHPDRFAAGSDQERRIAVQTTALLNEAFQTLKDPIARANYLLELSGVASERDSQRAMDPVFLAEQIEFRERLDDARHSKDSKARLADLATDVESRLRQTTDELRARLVPGTAELERACRIVREMQFLTKLRRQIAELEE